jgi:hypothetical protein
MLPLDRQAGEPDMVKLISLKDQDEPVKRFFESLIPDPTGAVVEVNGHRVYLFVRPVAEADPPDEPWTDSKNHRRAELVDREIAGTLTPAEAVELAELQRKMMRYVDRVAPLPIDDARKLHKQLLEKARSAGDSGDASA